MDELISGSQVESIIPNRESIIRNRESIILNRESNIPNRKSTRDTRGTREEHNDPQINGLVAAAAAGLAFRPMAHYMNSITLH